MKKILATACAALLAGTIAWGANVYSVNAVGYVKKTIAAGKASLLTCNFEKVGGGTNTLLDVFGATQLAQNDILGLCDVVMMWDVTEQKYQAYAQWTDGKFYKANDATEWGLSIEANPEFPIGSGAWLIPSGGQVGDKVLTLAGQVVGVVTQTVSLVSGFQMAAYPLSCSRNIQQTGLFASGANADDILGNCDLLITWDGDQYQSYAPWTDGNWYLANDATQWGLSILASNTIAMGEGFWYFAKTDLTWKEGSPYYNNLKQ